VGLSGAGLIAGLTLLGRGMAGYRRAAMISDVSSSRIASLAVGEVRVSGVVEAAELSLVSPLQSASCVYYRGRITETRNRDRHTLFNEERSVGFRVRDTTGTVRIFPRGARWDVPWRLDEHDGALANAVGLRMRTGSAIQVGELDREVQVAALLTVRQPTDLPDEAASGGDDLSFGIGSAARGERHYQEARLEIGDPVTVVGGARRFDEVPDPTQADEDSVEGDLSSDPEVAADLAAAQAAGTLAASPDEAWGNAAIPGFGIDRPACAPHLDAGARAAPIVAETAERASRAFDIPPDELVLATSQDEVLLIAQGAPGTAEERNQRQFLVGLLGALLSLGAAVALAVELSTTARP